MKVVGEIVQVVQIDDTARGKRYHLYYKFELGKYYECKSIIIQVLTNKPLRLCESLHELETLGG